jgi:hypothetical protein
MTHAMPKLGAVLQKLCVTIMTCAP